MKKLEGIRKDYDLFKLKKSGLKDNPMELFDEWMQAALETKVDEPTAFALSTVDKYGIPSSRILLLKSYDERGFHFYTNYKSAKAKEMNKNPNVALNIHWKPLHRQVRVVGVVKQMKRKESEAYFSKRPRGSQLGAWASDQSKVLKSRNQLKERLKQVEKQFSDFKKVPCPPDWGGYIIQPEMIEFWQGRESRLHDRFRYTNCGEGDWSIDRLWP